MDRRAVALVVLVALGACGPSRGPTFTPLAAAEAGPPGSRAAALLGAAVWSSVVVQVDWAPGLEPTPSALALLEKRLGERCSKPVSVTLGHEVLDARRSVSTLADLQAIEARERTRHASGAEGALHVIYVDGRSDRDGANTPLLGVSLTATSFAVFARTVKDDPPPFVTPEELEGAVLVHEAGHLLGLVGLDGPPSSEHEDRAHPPHCSTDGCIMAAESTGWDFISVDFCARCKTDLAAHARD